MLDFLFGEKVVKTTTIKEKTVQVSKRMYSEEEVRFIAFQFHYEMSKYMKVPSYYMSDTTIDKERIFEKFKKK